ncbi:hypothetical protein SPRG_20550 [Saprolegnia parasitica CBS 223.65]|uniref:Disintegrin domain-containing protein n=1 Tax=Saprolegnia parasitica (strain CBS 223.65) TaxID=695850 RepID=A0A067C8E4_SAPPC|nr:hypothetical protein SPRG_20550 [Saprolegnia parasitica CBS 223.65]KDO26753.1 hypothetical protein SPRG_20550 [Saprolegnia parasitica CBS 223.65]|eukprot:XP_012202632.1 hypothetical protein SPRG_20550 [Saprolegnia parasitica CBS 223.65]
MKTRIGVYLAVAIIVHANAHKDVASVASKDVTKATATSRALAAAETELQPQLFDIISNVLDPITGVLDPVLDPITDILDPVLDPITGVLDPVLDPITDLLDPVLDPITDLLDPITDVLDPLLDPITDLLDPITDVIVPVLDPITGLLDPITDVLEPVLDPITGLLDPITDVIVPVLDPIIDVLDPITNVLDPITGVLDPIIDVLDPITGVLDPITGVLDPITDVLDPIIDVLDPIIDVLDPITNVLDPIIDIAPITNVLDPIIDVLDPITDVLDPITGVLDPIIDVPVQPTYSKGPRYGPTHVDYAANHHYREDSADVDTVTIADEEGCPEVPCREVLDFENGKCTYTQLPRGTLCPGQSCDNDGPCDADENDYCDGDGTCLNGYKDQTTVCRKARNLCDAAEYCRGDNSQCPHDEFAPSSKVCTKMGKSTGGPCDAPDYCDGHGRCVDKFQSRRHICRHAVDVCDNAETCTGVSGDCPSNSFARKGIECTAIGQSSGGACDDVDRCDGYGKCVDHFKSTKHLCRREADVCDEPEYCSGECGVCPDDVAAPMGKVCTHIGKSSGGKCDGVDVCDGHGRCIETFLGSDVVCRQASDICDVPEYCTSYNGKCPRDEFASRTTECTSIGESSDHACDGVDYCDGSGKCVDTIAKDTLCHAAEDLCDTSRFCNGVHAWCPHGNDGARYGDDYASAFAYKARQCSAKATQKFVSVYDAPGGQAALLLVAVAMVGAVAAMVAVSVSKKEGSSIISMEDGYVPLTQDML